MVVHAAAFATTPQAVDSRLGGPEVAFLDSGLLRRIGVTLPCRSAIRAATPRRRRVLSLALQPIDGTRCAQAPPNSSAAWFQKRLRGHRTSANSSFGTPGNIQEAIL